MPTLPDRETSRLRFGRSTAPEAFYFISTCTKDRAPVLTKAETARIVANTFQSLHSSGDIQLIASTIMPDHTHFLFRLGERLCVGQVMGKFKAWSRDMGHAPWRWQHDGFEHQLRSIESIEDYGFYIFMNPYRAGLCSLQSAWPWWICPQPSVFRFLTQLTQNQPVPPAWLGLSDQIASRIPTGD